MRYGVGSKGVSMARVTRASLILEIDGKTCVALLDGIDLDLMVSMIGPVCVDGVLKVVPLNKTFTWDAFTKNDYKGSIDDREE